VSDLPRFTQGDYSAITDALDDALNVFLRLTGSEESAQAALKDFVAGHYVQYWRAVSPSPVVAK
jgi:hypothetical protein